MPLTYEQQAELIEKQRLVIEEQALKIRMLEAKVEMLLRRFFGKSGEALDPKQLTLLMEGLDPKAPPPKDEPCAVAEPPRHRAKARTSRRPRLPEHLPVVEKVVDPVEVQQDPGAWRCISVTCRIDIITFAGLPVVAF